MEKKTWKAELSQKMKEIESLQASAKRSNSCRFDVTQKAEQYLAERNDLELEVADLGKQVRRLQSLRSCCDHAITHIRCTNKCGYPDQLHDIDN